MKTSKFKVTNRGDVQGVVIGDGNTVTLIFQNNENRDIPFLAPHLPSYNLVGRESILQELKQKLFMGGSLALTALNGLPGVGKTAIAIALANDGDVLAHFHDGVLWAGVGREADVLSHLGTWGAVLGISPEEMSKLTTSESRTKAIHTIMGMRRMLLVVDDAWETSIALKFKVGGPNCSYILTTRLPNVALDFAGDTTTVHELQEEDGFKLLGHLAPRVVEVDPDNALKLVRAVGCLPLALIVMGNYLRRESNNGQLRRLYKAIEKLQKAEERLKLNDETQSPIEHHPSLPVNAYISLDAVIGVSDDALDKKTREALRTLSVFPQKPNTFSEEAALAVAGITVREVDILFDAGLLELESSDHKRYTLHQAISDYGRARLVDESAYERMIEYFVKFAELNGTNHSMLELEITNIIVALQTAFERGIDKALIRGANAFYPFLQTRGLYGEIDIHLRRAEQVARQLGDTDLITKTLLNLGRMLHRRGDLTQTEKYFSESLALSRVDNLPENISASLQALGAVKFSYGNYIEAEKYFEEGLTVARLVSDPDRISAILWNLSTVLEKREDYVGAELYAREGLELAKQIGNRERVGTLLRNLAVLAADHGDLEQAERLFRESLNTAREIKHRWLMCYILYRLGDLYIQQGKLEEANVMFSETIETAKGPGIREFYARGLFGLAQIAFARNNVKDARMYGQESYDIFQSIEHYKAKEVSKWLSEQGFHAS